jgi:hypothetical protein
MYATTRYNFVRLKAMHKISPLEELVGDQSLVAIGPVVSEEKIKM